MSFFGLGPNYNRPGPGIPKDAPKKKGAALFFEILGREFWSLLVLNLTYVLACIPIITIGPATVALNRVTITMVRDQNVYPWRDFWDAMRKNWKQGLLFGIPATLFVAAAIWINLGMLLGGATTLSMAFIFLWTFLGVSLGCYIFPMAAYVDLPSLPMLKNSMFLIVLGKFRTIAAVAVSIAASTLAIAYFPISPMVMIFLGYFAFLSLFISFMVWPVIERFVINGGEQPAE
ncbi:MAG: YesL family protein, partial [Angelakisella sp.]